MSVIPEILTARDCVEPTATESGDTVIVGVVVCAFETVTLHLLDSILPTFAVILAVPSFLAVTVAEPPLLEATSATDASLELQFIPVKDASLGVAVAVIVPVSPSFI